MDEQQNVVDVLQQSVSQEIKPVKFPGAWEILRNSCGYVASEWKYFIKVILWPMVMVWVAILGLALVGAGGGFVFRKDAGAIVIFTIVLLVVVIMAEVVIQMWGAVALMLAVTEADSERKVRATYGRAWPLVRKYWWVMILSSMVSLGGLIFFIVPAFVIGLNVMMAGWVVVCEKTGGMQALLKSRFLMKGRVSSIMWRMFIPTMIFSVIGLITEDLMKIEIVSVRVVVVIISVMLFFAQTMVMIVVSEKCYRALVADKTGLEFNPDEARVKYIILGFLGIIPFLTMLILPIVVLLTVNPGQQMKKARDVAVKMNVQEIKMELNRYYIENGKLPQTLQELKSEIPPDVDLGKYYYQTDSSSSFRICAVLESKKEEYCDDNFGNRGLPDIRNEL